MDEHDTPTETPARERWRLSRDDAGRVIAAGPNPHRAYCWDLDGTDGEVYVVDVVRARPARP